MEYSIRELAEISGVSSRTLRYYDSIGLLTPARVSDAGYRFYGEKEMLLLQQIFFYRERGFSLEEIQQILYQKDFDLEKALQEHLRELEKRQNEIADMIKNVKCTIASMKGEWEMSEKERFDGFKQRIVKENEAVYSGALSRGRTVGRSCRAGGTASRLLCQGVQEVRGDHSRRIYQSAPHFPCRGTAGIRRRNLRCRGRSRPFRVLFQPLVPSYDRCYADGIP